MPSCSRGLIAAALALATSSATPAGAAPATGDVVEATRGATIYARPGSRHERGAVLPRARFRVGATRSGKGCRGVWLEIGAGAWLCSRDTRATDQPPGGVVEPALEPGRSLPFTYVATHDARVYPTLEDAAAGRSSKRLAGTGGYKYRGTRDAGGKRYVKTDMGWIPADQADVVSDVAFQGIPLTAADHERRLAFVAPRPAPLYDRTGTRLPDPAIVAHHYLGEIGAPLAVGDRTLYPIGNGRHLDRKDLSLIEFAPPPDGIGADEPWIDVHLKQQTLVAYRGAQPVFATLVSTAHTATPPGRFRIQRKRAYARMRSKPGHRTKWDVDLPWAMTLDGRFAMHTVYWHNHFGRPKSQGCVNLSPRDARWIWDFTGPALPPGWARIETQRAKEATLVRVRR